MLDEFTVKKPAGFPDHPHRGFETVGLYIIPRGLALSCSECLHGLNRPMHMTTDHTQWWERLAE